MIDFKLKGTIFSVDSLLFLLSFFLYVFLDNYWEETWKKNNQILGKQEKISNWNNRFQRSLPSFFPKREMQNPKNLWFAVLIGYLPCLLIQVDPAIINYMLKSLSLLLLVLLFLSLSQAEEISAPVTNDE